MKTLRLFVAFALLGFVVAAVQAGEDKKEAKPAGCCAKAEAKGEKCGHGCCVEAAKAGSNCEKCGGAGKAAKKEEAKN
jgi:hypothetical protein